MASVRIRREDREKVNLYMDLSGTFITVEGGKWVLTSPEDRIIYNSTESMMEDVNTNLVIMEEVYRDAGEMVDFLAAVERSKQPQKKKPYAQRKAERLGLTEANEDGTLLNRR